MTRAGGADALLIEAAQSGECGAIERLLETCRPDLRRYAALNCRASDVEDAVQESLLVLHRHVGALRSVASFAGWMFRVVQRQCLRMARQNPHTQTALDEVELLPAPRQEIDLRLDLARAIQSLPDIYRDVIVLRDFSELSVAEISAHLGLLPATVKTRIHRGRQMIREHLLS